MKPFHSPKIKFRNRVLKFLSPNFTENKSDRNCDGSISLKQIYKALKEPERFIVVQKGGEKKKSTAGSTSIQLCYLYDASFGHYLQTWHIHVGSSGCCFSPCCRQLVMLGTFWKALLDHMLWRITAVQKSELSSSLMTLRTFSLYLFSDISTAVVALLMLNAKCSAMMPSPKENIMFLFWSVFLNFA